MQAAAATAGVREAAKIGRCSSADLDQTPHYISSTLGTDFGLGARAL